MRLQRMIHMYMLDCTALIKDHAVLVNEEYLLETRVRCPIVRPRKGNVGDSVFSQRRRHVRACRSHSS